MVLIADPRASYLAHREALDGVLREVMESGRYILGTRVKSFEEHFAEYTGATHCIGVANGTDAIHLALRSCGVGPGDGVITASQTAVATVAAIEWVGAKPILVDIHSETYTIDPQKVQDTLQVLPRGAVKAVVAVHLYGHLADMERLLQITERRGTFLIEDCAQAHGALVGSRKAGSMGVCGAFSFYPTKNLGAFGDGGAILTNSSAIAEKIRLLQQYGWKERYISDLPGYNSRLDELQAAVLDWKLKWLDEGNDRRRKIAERYTKDLSTLPIMTPVELSGYRHVYHQYVIRVAKDRNRLRRHLQESDIQTAILYPMPVHLQPAYRNRVLIGEGGMRVTEQAATEILSLPIYPELEDSDVQTVVEAIKSYFQ